eukprot:360765-Amphidinium_carterae.1
MSGLFQDCRASWCGIGLVSAICVRACVCVTWKRRHDCHRAVGSRYLSRQQATKGFKALKRQYPDQAVGL